MELLFVKNAIMEITTDRLTQEQRILKLLKDRGGNGVSAWEITNNLHILQYNARIHGLRKKGHNIINVKPGLFVLREFKEEPIVGDKLTDKGKQLMFL